jgi:hypothetical protein
MVSFIVGNMHVGTAYSEVVKEFYRRFKAFTAKGGQKATKRQRKEVYRKAIACHRENRELVREFRL